MRAGELLWLHVCFVFFVSFVLEHQLRKLCLFVGQMQAQGLSKQGCTARQLRLLRLFVVYFLSDVIVAEVA